MSVVLTVISLGTRVLLSYTLAPIKSIGVIAIWWSIPIGWFLADVTGYVYLQYMNKKAKCAGINPAHFLYSIYQNR